MFVLAHLSSASFTLFPSLFLMLRPFVLPNKDAAAQSKHLCSLGLCKCTFIFSAGDSELHTNAVLFALEHLLSHFNHVHSPTHPVSLCRWVQIACPRLSIDWGTAFSKPLLSPYEVHTSNIHHRLLLKQWEEISFTPATWASLGSASQNLFMLRISPNSTFPRGKLDCPVILYAWVVLWLKGVSVSDCQCSSYDFQEGLNLVWPIILPFFWIYKDTRAVISVGRD